MDTQIVALLLVALAFRPSLDTGVEQNPNNQALVSATAATVVAQFNSDSPWVTVRITNRSNLPIESWQVQMDYSTAAGLRDLAVTTDTYAALGSSRESTHGPIAPNSSREERFALAGPPSQLDAKLTMLLFVDFSSAGDIKEKNRVLRQREGQAAHLAQWISIATPLIKLTPDSARAALEQELAKAEEQASRNPRDDGGSYRQTIRSLLDSSQPPKFIEHLESLINRLAVQRQNALRHLQSR